MAVYLLHLLIKRSESLLHRTYFLILKVSTLLLNPHCIGRRRSGQRIRALPATLRGVPRDLAVWTPRICSCRLPLTSSNWSLLSTKPHYYRRQVDAAERVSRVLLHRSFCRHIYGYRRGSKSDAAACSSVAEGGSKPAPVAPGSKGGGWDGKSQQGDSMKVVRGGPVSWLSFLLLLVAGGESYFTMTRKRSVTLKTPGKRLRDLLYPGQ